MSEPTSVLDLASTISPASSPGTSPSHLNNPGIAAPSLHKSIVHRSYHHMQSSGTCNDTLASISHSHEVGCRIAPLPLQSANAFELSSTLSDGCNAMSSEEPHNQSLQEVLHDLHANLEFELDTKSTLDDIFADSPSSFVGHEPNVWDETDMMLLGPDDNEFIPVQGSLSNSVDKFLSARVQAGSAKNKTCSSPNNSMDGIVDEPTCHSPACRMERPDNFPDGKRYAGGVMQMVNYGQSPNQEELQSPCSCKYSTKFAEYESCFDPFMDNCEKCNSQFKCCYTPWMECNSGQLLASTCREQQRQEEHGLELVHLLLLCARMIGEQHNRQVQPLLKRLQKMSSPLGNPLERIAHYVSQAMFERVSDEISRNKEMTAQLQQLPLTHLSITDLDQQEMEIDAFHLALYQALPYTKFLYFTANQTILEASAESSHIHVIDFDIQQGIQWPSLFQSLAIRPGGAPKMVKMSAIGTCIMRLNQTGKMLAEFAQALHLNFTYQPIVIANVKEVNVGMFASRNPTDNEQSYKGGCNTTDEEAIAVNLSTILQSPMWEGVRAEVVLSLVQKLHPRVITVMKAERQNEAISYVDKFTEILFYFSAFFDSIEASLGRSSPDRETLEKVLLSHGLKSIISVTEKEEEENMVMNVSTENWQGLMNRHGFHSVQFSDHALYQAKLLLNLYTTQAFKVGCSHATSALSIYWQQIPIFSVLAFSSYLI
ncbi:hypothetical protein L7F22_055250 [Adiantum nelumboides]|nr:hypothetical protein [Adiantum nelumboides]